mgnify:CR=1 FL=1
MRRVSTLLVLLLSVIAVYAGGINSAKDLLAFATALNGGADISAWQNEKGEVCLEGDIDMAKVKRWTPIKEFKGTFDGKGYTISGLYYDNDKTTGGYVGLFCVYTGITPVTVSLSGLGLGLLAGVLVYVVATPVQLFLLKGEGRESYSVLLAILSATLTAMYFCG